MLTNILNDRLVSSFQIFCSSIYGNTFYQTRHILSTMSADLSESLQQGHNVVVLGQAGTGKSHLLREFTQSSNKNIDRGAVTASTGISASLKDGVTVHR